MGRWRAGSLLLVGVLAVLLAPGIASGETELFGLKLDGSVDLGALYLLEQPSRQSSGKFEEYRGDVRAGALLEDLRLELSTKDDRYRFEVGAKEIGEDDQSFSLRSSRTGRYEFEFQWDRTPHIYSTNGRMLGTEAPRGVFTLPSPRPPLSAHNAAPGTGDIGIRWDTARATLAFTPTPDIDLKAEYSLIRKEGDRPFGVAFGSPGNNFREVLEPIDQTIHSLKLSASLARESYQLQLSYDLSIFENDFDAVISDNPSQATDGPFSAGSSAPRRGRVALPPDNVAHTFTFTGGANLPLRTRVNGTLSYGVRLQNQEFLPHTINGNITNPGLTLPQSDLNGDVRTALVNLSASSRPTRDLTLRGRYRYYDKNDRSDEIVFPARVLNDRTLEAEPRTATRFDYSKQNLDLEGRWRFAWPVALTAGGGWERWDRDDEHREVGRSDEYLTKLALDSTPLDWLLLRLTYAPSWRRIGSYNTFAHLAHSVTEEEFEAAHLASQSLLLRKYDEADRDRQRLDVLAQVTPSEMVTASFTASLRDDQYENSFFGLQDDRSWAAGVDVTLTPTDRLAIFAGYVWEKFDARLRSRYRPVATVGGVTTSLDFPDFDWVGRNIDLINTFSLGVDAVVIPKLVDLRLAWNYSVGTTKMRAFNPVKPTSSTAANQASATAVDFPQIENAFHQLEARLRLHLTKAASLNLRYLFERWDQTDYRTNDLQPSTGADIFLGNDLKDYTAHIVALTLGLRF